MPLKSLLHRHYLHYLIYYGASMPLLSADVTNLSTMMSLAPYYDVTSPLL